MNIRSIDGFKELFYEMNGGQILDVACGEGQFIDIMQTALKSWEHITGLDVNEEILKLASRKFHGSGFAGRTG